MYIAAEIPLIIAVTAGFCGKLARISAEDTPLRRQKGVDLMHVLVVVDMQNDFVSGSLGTKEAVGIVPSVVGKVAEAVNRGDLVVFTRDTHGPDYLDSREGRSLPVAHCVRGTEGWEIIPQLTEYTRGRRVVDKPTFASRELGELLAGEQETSPVETITLVGLCTDICVISNAMVLRAFLPEAEIVVDAACCAGVTPESHAAALAAMRSCQILVENG